MLLKLSIIALALSPALLFAQDAKPEGVAAPVAAPVAAKEDVESIDAIMAAIYDVISGPAGEQRDWDRMQSQFYEDYGRLMPVSPGRSGGVGVGNRTPHEYGSASQGFFDKEPFHEREIARKTEHFGHIAHVFSTYEWRLTDDMTQPAEQRGVNSMQLFFDDERWYVLSILWDAESETQKLPPEYLPESK